MGSDILRDTRKIFRRAFGSVSISLAQVRGKRVSYSQLGEDVWLMRNFMNVERSDLICMEVGAYDPTTYSNTFAFEKYLNARSILVEPSLSRSLKIQSTRPTASVYCAVASDDFGLEPFLGDSAVAGIETKLSQDYIEQWELSAAPRRWVPSIPVSAIQNAEGLEYLDVLSIDVQGAELAVLRGISWSAPIGCICIELEGIDLRKDEACRSLLLSRGYRLHARIEINEFWILSEYARRRAIWEPTAVPSLESFTFPYLEPHAASRVLDSLRELPSVEPRR